MGIPMAYNTGTTNTYTEKTVKRGTVALNPGPSLAPSYNWFNGVDVTATQYLIYSDTYTTGQATQANSRPTAWTTPDLSDTSLLNLINTLPERIGQTPFTYAPVALKWLHQSNRYFLIKNNFENIVTSGLILNLDASWPTSFSGTSTWFDLSSSNKNATLINGPTLNTANGGSVQFDGTNDYTTTNQTLTTPITITGFIKYNDQSQGNNTWIDVTPHTVLVISINRTGIGDTYVYIGNGSGNWFATPAINASQKILVNTWYHMAFVSNGSNSTLYINGVNVGSSIYSPSGYGTSYRLGSIVYGSEYLDGNIGNTQIYNRALSPAEIMQNFNAQGYRFGYSADTIVTSGLTLSYDVANGMSYPASGTTLYDISLAGGNNGTLTNGPSFITTNGGGFTFDGTNDYISTGKGFNNLGMGNSSYTAEIIYYRNSTNSADQTLFGVDANGLSIGLHLIIRQNCPYFGHYSSDTGASIQTTNGFFHVVFVFDKTSNMVGNQLIYINGSLNVTGTGKAALNSTNDYPVNIGGNTPWGYYNGNIYLARIYNRALSSSEITQNFNATKGRFGL
jgi:hypothetical protein